MRNRNALKSQIDKLEDLAHHTAVNPAFDQFDAATEDILINIYGANHQLCGILQTCHGGGG